jgi:outer membrane receptor for ferrienterochelin and colicins
MTTVRYVLLVTAFNTAATAAEAQPLPDDADAPSSGPSKGGEHSPENAAPAVDPAPSSGPSTAQGVDASAAVAPPPTARANQASSGPSASNEPFPQSIAPDADSVLEDLSLVDLLGVKVTVASRTPVVAADAPGSMTVFTREQIQRMAVSTLEDLLNYVAGVQVTSDAIYGRLPRISVRGMFSTVNSGVLLLRDGVPDWNAFDGSAWHFSRHFMLNDVERVEVMRGPGSTMWGTNASSAVVNVVTVKDRNTISVGYGTLARRELSANFHHQVSPDLKVSGSLQGYADGGFAFKRYTDAFGVTGDIKDPLSQYTARVRAEYEKLTLTVNALGTWWREYVEWAGASRNNRNSIDRYNAELAYPLDLGPTADITFGLTYAHDSYSTLGLNVPDGIELIPGQPLATEWTGGPTVSTRVARLRADATWRPSDDNTFNAGFSGAHGWMVDAYHFSNYDPHTLAPYSGAQLLRGDLNFVDENGRQTLIGVYAQDMQRLGPVALTLGGRLDVTRTNAKLPGPFERQTSTYTRILPRAAITYKTPIDSTAKLMYGRAFRAPSISELTLAHNPVVVGGLAAENQMRPEIVDTGELAYTQNLFTKLSATGTGYVTYVSNLITPGRALTPADPCFPFCPPGSTALGNHSRLLTTGLELELMATP